MSKKHVQKNGVLDISNFKTATRKQFDFVYNNNKEKMKKNKQT